VMSLGVLSDILFKQFPRVTNGGQKQHTGNQLEKLNRRTHRLGLG